MHLLNYLRKRNQEDRPPADASMKDEVLVEYRLISSGTLFPDHFLGDWSKSDRARILLQCPVHLLVASQPYRMYPQELALRFCVSMLTEEEGNSWRSYDPDPEIASDLAALLTLLCRRLITVSVRVRKQLLTPGPPGPFPPPPSVLRDYPCPAVTTAKKTHWVARPTPPQPFDSGWIMNVLAKLPDLPAGKALIRAARLYALAMELIENQHEICYQLLISAVETMAGEVDLKWTPETKDKLELQSSKALISCAKKEGISEDVAKRLSLEACKDYSWSGRKFREFILENVNHADLAKEDDLFCVPEMFCPSREQLGKALGEIYQARGGATHKGHAYPVSACIGPSHMIPTRAMDAIINEQPAFPPVGWFERIVNSAICGYLRSQVEKSALVDTDLPADSTIYAGPALGSQE